MKVNKPDLFEDKDVAFLYYGKCINKKPKEKIRDDLEDIKNGSIIIVIDINNKIK